MKKIAQGAEAVVYSADGKVVKRRLSKSYRLDEIDVSLRKSRTRREAKVLTKLASLGIPVPALISVDDKEMTIDMELIDGPKLRDVLARDNCEAFCKEVGSLVAQMHKAGVIHGDLTTSNMIVMDRVYLIDFGLSFFSSKAEDMAVDLHLLKQALLSKHHAIWEMAFSSAVSGYCDSCDDLMSHDVMQRFKKVEARGRHKGKH